jgi:hypothetical protein
MKAIQTIVLGVLTASFLSGCVVAIGNEGRGRESDWAQVERDNRAAIDSLLLGMEFNEARARMPHDPAFSEAFTVDGVAHRVLFYRTQRVEGDGVTTRDETTPLVFIEGRLAGWGESAMVGLPVHSAPTVE